jgi:hypothetical protein
MACKPAQHPAFESRGVINQLFELIQQEDIEGAVSWSETLLVDFCPQPEPKLEVSLSLRSSAMESSPWQGVLR